MHMHKHTQNRRISKNKKNVKANDSESYLRLRKSIHAQNRQTSKPIENKQINKQTKTKQNKAKQSNAKQNKTK